MDERKQMGDDNVKMREVTLTEDDWIYLQNKLESILETEDDDLLEAISATIFAELAGIWETSEEELKAMLLKAEKKLEAIKTLFLPLPEWVEWEEVQMSIEASKMLKLKEILEAED